MAAARLSQAPGTAGRPSGPLQQRMIEMQTESKILDDLARLVGGAVGAANGARQELEQIIRARMERMLAHMDLVPREEFEAVRAMAIKAREEQEALASRVAALEEKLAAAAAGSAPRAAPAGRRKPAAKS